MNFRKLALAAVTSLFLGVTSVLAQPADAFYVGLNVGTTMQDANRGVIGGNAGWQFHQNFAVEATYDYNQVTGTPNNGQIFMANAVAGYPNHTPFTPYMLVGTGIGWNAASGTNNGTMGMWNVGAGFHVALSPQLSLDNRYRYVGPYNSATGRDAQVITTGINYKF